MLWSMEFWKTDWGKALITFLIVVIFVSVIWLSSLWLNNQPLQIAHVTVLSKRINKGKYNGGSGVGTSYYAVFRFPDESEKEFYVKSIETYNAIKEGDVGMLSYRQIGDGTGIGGKRFISFEKDI